MCITKVIEMQYVIVESKCGINVNMKWIWITGLIEHLNKNLDFAKCSSYLWQSCWPSSVVPSQSNHCICLMICIKNWSDELLNMLNKKHRHVWTRRGVHLDSIAWKGEVLHSSTIWTCAFLFFFFRQVLCNLHTTYYHHQHLLIIISILSTLICFTFIHRLVITCPVH